MDVRVFLCSVILCRYRLCDDGSIPCPRVLPTGFIISEVNSEWEQARKSDVGKMKKENKENESQNLKNGSVTWFLFSS
jgi:hypothetical protein